MEIRWISLEDLICPYPPEDDTCKCDRSKPRNVDDMLPHAEELEAAGICPWCGFSED